MRPVYTSDLCAETRKRYSVPNSRCQFQFVHVEILPEVCGIAKPSAFHNLIRQGVDWTAAYSRISGGRIEMTIPDIAA